MKTGIKVAIGTGIAGVTGLILWALTKKEAPPPEVYKCPYCGEKFSTQEELTAHILSQHPDQPLVYVCPFCGVTFATEEELANHIASEHPPKIEITSLTWDGIPPFTVNEKHTAYVELKNLTSQVFNYIAELFVGTSGATKTFSLNSLETKTIELSIAMPSIEGTYLVYVNVFVAGELIAQYIAEPVTLVKAAFMTLVIPTPLPYPPPSPLPAPQPPAGAHPLMVTVYGQTNFVAGITYFTGAPHWTTYHVEFQNTAHPPGATLLAPVRNYYYEAVNIDYIDPYSPPFVDYVDYLVEVVAHVANVGVVPLTPWYPIRLKPGATRIDIKSEQP